MLRGFNNILLVYVGLSTFLIRHYTMFRANILDFVLILM